MIENLNSQQFAGGEQLAGRIKVFPARVGRSSRVIVSDDNTVGVIQDSGFKDLSWVN